MCFLHNKTEYGENGFTFVELLVALALSAAIGTSIMTLYANSSKTYETQSLVSEAQQNARGGMDALVWDLRMAGYDPTREADAGFLQAGNNIIQFTMDLTDDGGTGEPDGDLTDTSGNADPNENVTYGWYTSSAKDVYGNDIRRLGRKTGVSYEPVAEYIEANGLAFAYAFDSNDDGQLDTDAGGRIHWAQIGANDNWWELDANGDDQISVDDDTDGNGVLNTIDTGIVADLNDIRAVKIWLLMTSPRHDRGEEKQSAYLVGTNIVTNEDNYSRRLLTTSVTCRNMGL